MEKEYLKDFEDSLATLEDIQLLSEFSLSPILSRAYFHITEMKRKADSSQAGNLKNFTHVSTVLDDKVSQIISDFFSNTSKFKTYDFIKNTEKIELPKWNTLLESLPEFLSVVSIFNFYGSVQVKLDADQMRVSGIVIEDKNLHFHRKFVYLVTRKLLKNKIILTFEMHKSSRSGFYELSLIANFSHCENLIYTLSFQSDNLVLGFSNMFPSYRANINDVKDIEDHLVVEIDQDFQVKKTTGRITLSQLDSVNKELLHFPFLFRPLSLILPMKGNLSTDSFVKSLERTLKDTGSESHQQSTNKSFQYCYIDFFSLFN